jgi:hypothetical protein
MKRRNITIFASLILLLINLSSCAPSGYEYNEAGFFSGIWHGLIIVFSLMGKLIGMDIGIYADNNTGFTYWLGFILGIGGFGGGSASSRNY